MKMNMQNLQKSERESETIKKRKLLLFCLNCSILMRDVVCRKSQK